MRLGKEIGIPLKAFLELRRPTYVQAAQASYAAPREGSPSRGGE